MRQALIAVLVLGLLAAVAAVQYLPAVRASASARAEGSPYDILVDWIRPHIPGAGIPIAGDTIWFAFKYLIIPLVAIVVLSLIGKKWLLVGLAVLAALIFIRW